MKLVIQRSKESSVSVDNKITGKIDKGLMILVGFTHDDTDEDIAYLTQKVLNLRIFDDENGIMNKSILDIKGSILLVSQFTLYAKTQKGNRPSYIDAMHGEKAIVYYEKFIENLRKYVPVETGIFGADMIVNLTNDGPVTIIMDSKNK